MAALKDLAAAITPLRAKKSSNTDDDQPKCPLCFDVSSGLMIVPGKGAVPCPCKREKIVAKALSIIPKEFGTPRFASIKADARRHRDQQKKIDYLAANPDQSYFIFGANGTGKTFLAWALYVHAVETAGRIAHYSELEALLDQYRKFEFDRDKEMKKFPIVMADDLRQAKAPRTIFLDEICATAASPYATKEFFQLLKAATEGGHQMIYTTNKSPEDMQLFWQRSDADIGNSIARRIADYATQVSLF